MKIRAFLVNNTPERLVFKNKIRQGIITKAQKQSLITPQELGAEQCESVVSCEPSEGVIGSYDQMPILFKMKTSFDGTPQIID